MSETATDTTDNKQDAAIEPSKNGPTQLPAVPMSRGGVVLANIEGLWRFATMIYRSGFAPKNMNVEAIAISIQMGLEVGLSPMQAMQSTAVINGRPGIFGDAAKALVEASGLLEDFDEWYEVDGQRVERTPAKATDDLTAVCMSKRKGRRAMITTFSVADAKNAQLWGKAGPWTQYWLRMLRWRARGFNLRDNFGDVLKGLRTVEEIQDRSSEFVDAPSNVAELDAPKAGVAGLADRLRDRAASVEANKAPELPSGEEPKPVDEPTGIATPGFEADSVLNDLTASVAECGNDDTLNSLLKNAEADIQKLSRASRPHYLQFEDALRTKREELAKEAATTEPASGQKKSRGDLYKESNVAK